MSKRPYRQHLRAEAAEQNRQRILDTLYDRLRAAPAQPVSVEEIARRAGISRSTIYLVFGSRSGLFDALTDRLLRGAGYDRIAEAVRYPDARETLRGGLEGGVRMGWLANRLHEQHHLRPDVTLGDAAHVIWLLASFDAYDQLAAGRGLNPEDVVHTLTRTAEHALLTHADGA